MSNKLKPILAIECLEKVILKKQQALDEHSEFCVKRNICAECNFRLRVIRGLKAEHSLLLKY